MVEQGLITKVLVVPCGVVFNVSAKAKPRASSVYSRCSQAKGETMKVLGKAWTNASDEVKAKSVQSDCNARLLCPCLTTMLSV